MRPAMLPGVHVTYDRAARPDPLPRMDVAVFAGFASSGPTHCAVGVDGPTAFQEVFGPDPTLAWDAARGTPVTGALGPAVRAFFENGGRRALVIRVCRTAWMHELSDGPGSEVALANVFPVPGVISAPGRGDQLSAALARARSVGSWSDGLVVRARCRRFAFSPSSIGVSDPTRVGFRTGSGVRRGDLVELSSATGDERAYVAVVEAAAAEVEGMLVARFRRLASDAAPAEGLAEAPQLGTAPVAVRLTPGRRTELAWLGDPPAGLRSGHWIRWTGSRRIDQREPPVIWLDTAPSGIGAGGVARGVAWREVAWREEAGPLPAERAAVVSLDLEVATDGARHRVEGIKLTPAAADEWWLAGGDDVFYRPGDLARPRPPLVREEGESPLAWIPLGLGEIYGPALGPVPHPGNTLSRDGLDKFGADLFIDPRLETLGTATLAEEAQRILSEPEGRLFGIHAVLAIPPAAQTGDLPSIIAAPDATQPGWEDWTDDAAPLAQPNVLSVPSHWAGHRGPCLEDAEGLEAPAFDRFLDCGTRLLARPALSAPSGLVPPGPVTLEWTASEDGAEYVLELSDSPDMTAAWEVERTDQTSLRVSLEREGPYYFRLTAHLGGETSLPSHASVLVRAASRLASAEQDMTELLRVHRAMLRLAHAEGTLFALLSLPRAAGPAEASAAARRLRAERGLDEPFAFAGSERQALSFGALLHGWLLHAGTAQRVGMAPPLSLSAPCGSVAGVLARRTLAGGAWLSPANQPIRGPVALAHQLDDADTLALLAQGVMPVTRSIRGFVLADGRTLADDEAWRPIGTRRLFALLRRLIARRADALVFEPNDVILRRAIERTLAEALATLFRRGAFAGFSPAEAYRVSVRPTSADADAASIVTEVAVAPGRPLAFLKVVLRQVGDRLTFEEER